MTSTAGQDTTVLDSMAAQMSCYGVAGDPLPYELRYDDTITLLMLAGFVVIATAFGLTQRFIFFQLKNFFHLSHNDAGRTMLSSSELRVLLLLSVQTCAQLAVYQYIYTVNNTDSAIAFEAPHVLTAVFFSLYVGWFVARAIAYTVVNNVFFDSRRNRDWQRSLLFLTAMEGVLLFLVLLPAVYLDLSVETVEVAVVSVVLLIKLLTAYKCYAIFFRQAGGFLQIILYLCTLEAVPLLLLWREMVEIGKCLTINY